MEINNDFGGASGEADLTLIVDKHKIPIIKILLTMSSPVFKAMFESDFAERGQTELELPGKKYSPFVTFLRCLYPDQEESVSEQNVDEILPLAHEYQIKKLLLSCGKVLLDSVINLYRHSIQDIPWSRALFRRLEQAETYDIEELKTKCIFLASELPTTLLSCEDFCVSIESMTKIYRLALRRHELLKNDVCRMIEANRDNMKSMFLQDVRVQTTYPFARLWMYYFPTNKYLKHEAVSLLKGTKCIGEEYDLLPESLKDLGLNV